MGDLGRKEIDSMLENSSDTATQYLTFSVAGERFAIDILGVREIIEVSLLTDVPLAPDYLRGVVNLRGAVLPVVDLAVRLARKQDEITKRSCIVVVSDGEKSNGILVDEVSEILEIAPELVQPIPGFGEKEKSDLLKGMGRIDDEFIVLLDMGHLLSEDDRLTLDQITGQLPSGP